MMTSVRVSANSSRLGQDVAIRQFHLTADEPSDLGGDDAGPTPSEFVLTGLGACKAITVRMYAERKGWKLEHVSIDLNLQKEGDRHLIHAHLNLEGALTDEQRQRLREIADRCPVHKLLTSDIDIQTVLE
jgi:putative redox protein